MFEGLSQLLRKKNDPKYAEEQEFEKQKQLSAIQVENYIKTKKAKGATGAIPINIRSVDGSKR
jgi:hypothetical protein